MSNTSASPSPILGLLIFIGIWLSLNAVFSLISGWLLLARNFRALAKPEGQKIIGQIKRMGLVAENLVTHMIVSESGLYLYASILFRFLHPALLIPWEEVHFVREVKTLWWYTYELDLASITRLRVTREAYEVIQKYLAAGQKTPNNSFNRSAN